MRRIIFLGLLIASLVSYNCVGMFGGEANKRSNSSPQSLIKLFKAIPGFNDWFSKFPKRVRKSMELYYDASNEFNGVIGVDSLYNIFFLNLPSKGLTLVQAVPIADEGSFQDIDCGLIKDRCDEVAFHNKFRLLQIALFITFMPNFLQKNSSWQKLTDWMQNMKQACSQDQLYSLLPNNKKSRLICYLLFRSPEQVRQAIFFYQANNNLSDKDVKKIVKQKKAIQDRYFK